MEPEPQKVYIAGPYSGGDWGTNVKNAVLAGDRVWRAGHVPFIPHTMTGLWSVLSEKSGDEWLEYDLEWLAECDALIRLPGESPGAEVEVSFANESGIDVYHSVDEFLESVGFTTIPRQEL